MITYIDSENRQDYTVLFNKASTKLGLLPIVEEVRDPVTLETVKTYSKRTYNTTTKTWEVVPCSADEVDTNTDTFKNVKAIASLNEYFQHIKDLAGLAIGQGRSGSDPYFLRLPLDEPFFEINANTRGITVPGELSQIAVRGDKLAEVVFFRIDRYYDAVDLNTRHIYIEWELPDGTKGISRDFLRDTQSEKDKIIFGWVIGDELTKQVGTIRFAVRFVEWFDGAEDDYTTERDTAKDYAQKDTQLLYSFSSLPATVTVVDSLNYSLFENDEALKIYNSTVTNENIGQMLLYLEDSDSDTQSETSPERAKIPVYVRDLTNEFYVDASEANANGEYVINLTGDGNRELRVEATSPDGGEISYVFGRIEHTLTEGTGIAPTGSKGIVAKIKFIEADAFEGEEGNRTFIKDRTFYAKDGTGAYIVVGEDDAVDGETYYERVAYAVVTLPGHYYAIADNRVGGKKTNNAHSSMMYIPWADKPVITTQMHGGENVVLNKQNVVLAPDANFNEAAAANRGYTNLRVVATDATEHIEAVTLAPIATAEHKSEEFTYRWFKQTDNHWAQKHPEELAKYTRPTGENALSDQDWADIEEGYLGENGDNWIEIPGATGATYTTSEPGLYAVKIENKFNNDYRATDLFEAGMIRVTNMPELPTVDWASFSNILDRGGIPSGVDVYITNEGNTIDYDEIKYQWHKVTIPDAENHPEWADDDEIATAEQINSPKGTLTFNAQGKATIPFEPNEFGSYFLEITNTLNGATSIYSSAGGTGTSVIRIEQVA